MTGFGKAEITIDNKKFTAEIRSLNSKQLDLSIKVPAAYRAAEYDLRNIASQMLVRGCDALVHHLHGAHLVDARKLAVKQETVPHAAALKHVRPVDWLAIDDALYRGGYAEGIVKRSKGVDIHIKHGVAHPCPYIVGETRTHHHHHVAVAYHASILTRLY